MPMASAVIDSPAGTGTVTETPVLVPRKVHRLTTLSPSAMLSSIVSCRSGAAASITVNICAHLRGRARPARLSGVVQDKIGRERFLDNGEVLLIKLVR